MPLLKQGCVVEDPFLMVEDCDDLPADPAVIVSFQRWLAERDQLNERTAPLGIKLKPDQDPRALGRDIHRFDVVALEFPKFSDGRSYSHARLIRERLDYEGELRAVGQVLQDQFRLMHRCGFDAVQAKDDRQAAAWTTMLDEIGHAYQPTADDQEPLYSIRSTGQ